MRILITGACGFVGSTLARTWLAESGAPQIHGLDNFIRPGSELHRRELQKLGVTLTHADVRLASDIEALPDVDFVIDAAAQPSVLAGVDGQITSRQLVEHNLLGTLNLLEYCKQRKAGFILLSSSRVYQLATLSRLPVERVEGRFVLQASKGLPAGVTPNGIDETFSTAAPVSLYGSTKLASEALALEYGATFGFPVFVNRCGVLAGAGQFGRADQGIYAYWLNSYLRRRALRYLGFGGHGAQVRDCLHPRDLVPLLKRQMEQRTTEQPIVNCSGGVQSTRSLAELTEWCAQRWGFAHPVTGDGTERPFDLPWVVLNAALAQQVWGWSPTTSTEMILEEIARHAEQHPDWLDLSSPRIAQA